jgi:hypothetical protein
MNYRNWVKWSNTIGLVSIVALVYWVFIYAVVEIFELRIFRERITNTFLFSVFGILAVMAGTLMVNVMFNLTRIAERRDPDAPSPASGTRRGKWPWFALAFPLVAGLLFAGDRLSAQRKEKMLIESAQALFAGSPGMLARLREYRFDESWIRAASDALELYAKADGAIDRVALLVQDEVGGMPVILRFNGGCAACRESGEENPSGKPRKQDFVQGTTAEERSYLESVFSGRERNPRFSATRGWYELFYPHTENGRTVVFHFSDYQRYGRLGSS